MLWMFVTFGMLLELLVWLFKPGTLSRLVAVPLIAAVIWLAYVAASS